jgi:maltokinase
MRRVEGADRSLVSRWIDSAQQAFLSAYQSCLQRHDHPSLLDERLLMPFRVEQECREFVYAEKHLPRWRYVPDAALQTLLP